MPWYSYLYNSMIVYDKTVPFGNGNPYPFWSSHILGQKRYELRNHLGNVMAVVSDKVIETSAGNRAALRAAHDYYPFGMLMPLRSIEDESIHCVPISRTRYENVLVYDGPVSTGPTSTFKGAILNADLTPGAEGVALDAGEDQVHLQTLSGDFMQVGIDLALPALSSTQSGVQISFVGEIDGKSPLEASLQFYRWGKRRMEGANERYNRWQGTVSFGVAGIGCRHGVEDRGEF